MMEDKMWDFVSYIKQTLTMRQYIGIVEGTYKLIVSNDIGEKHSKYFARNKNNQYELITGCMNHDSTSVFPKFTDVSELLFRAFNFERFMQNNWKEYCKLKTSRSFKSMIWKEYGHIRLKDISEATIVL